MRPPRPHIPLKTRLAVLERQAFVERKFDTDEECDLAREWYQLCCYGKGLEHRISWLLEFLFRGADVELDHDPALVLRRYSERTGRYIPDANNPNYMLYRRVDDHLQKTTGRRPGAETTVTSKGSDIWLAKKFRKLESSSPSSSRPKSRIPSRPFPKRKKS